MFYGELEKVLLREGLVLYLTEVILEKEYYGALQQVLHLQV